MGPAVAWEHEAAERERRGGRGVATMTRVLPWRRRPREEVDETSALLTAFRDRHPGVDTSMIERAYRVALAAHAGQTRKSGEPYIHHPMSVATIVARQGLDDVTVASALLHDAVEDTTIGLDDLKRDFGNDVAMIVDGVTKLDRLQFNTKEDQQAASVRKMLVALAKDLRVLIIKLADRLHNMRTLAALPEHKQQRVAQETLDIYAPLANRLGMQEVKDQLEDLALATLHPKRYSQIDQMVQDRSPERDLYLAQVVGEVEARLAEVGITGTVDGRPKQLWSIYEKMIVKGRSFDEIHDLLATIEGAGDKDLVDLYTMAFRPQHPRTVTCRMLLASDQNFVTWFQNKSHRLEMKRLCSIPSQ